MEANNVTADAFRHASISQRENSDAVFTSEKLDKSDNLVNEINNLTINESGYELNKATVSGTQGYLTSDSDTVTHTSNRIFDQKMFSCRTIGEVYLLPPPRNPMIRLAPQTLLTHVAK